MSEPKNREEKRRRKARPDRSAGSLGLRLDAARPTEVSVPRVPAVVLTRAAFSRLFGYAGATDIEVSLLGVVDREGGVFTVREFFLVAQAGSAAHTELDPAALGEQVERLVAEGRAEEAAALRCWAHSHPGMGAFWSRTDDTTCRRLCGDYLVALVVGEDFTLRARLDVAGPVPFTLDPVPVYCASPVDPAVAEACRREVKDKVRPVPLPTSGTSRNGHPKEKSTMRSFEPDVELVEYCDLCGGWHPEGECPMELEASAYQLARDERAADGPGPWDDEVWF